MVLVIDNYDSFTYNLVHQIGALGYELQVFRNDAITLDEIEALAPSHIVISPGPGRPEDAGISEELVSRFGNDIPILGVCLGHQAIGEVFGAEVGPADTLVHGKTSPVFHDARGIFQNIPNPFNAGRYHSLTVTSQELPEELEALANSGDGHLMALRHRTLPIYGVQFHPESILTEYGDTLIQNFLNLSRED